MTWRLSGNLAAIRQSVRTAYGNVTVGTIGDSAHSRQASDHNPDNRGIVTAIDVMLPVGSRASSVVKAAVGRPDLAYIIHNRTIWSAAYGWRARRYTGSDPHTNHVHISSKHSTFADDYRVGLNLGGGPSPAPVPPPAPTSYPRYPGYILRQSGRYDGNVKTWQRRMKERGWNIGVDGYFGQQTLSVVKAFQREKGLRADGLIGPRTWGTAWTSKVT